MQESFVNAFIEAVRPEFEDRLARLVSVPTVSADPRHQKDILRGAELAASYLEESGFTAHIVPTDGYPVVFGQLITNPDWPTLTIYNHLDVQPAAHSEWLTDPFKLTIENDRYIGRGATDDKGPALTTLAAVKLARGQGLPLNFKYIWELEEEIGSPHFAGFVHKNRDQLHTDSVLVSDSIWIAKNRPAIPYGLRGMVTFELRLKTGEQDVHSGLAGGVARNPLGEIAYIITECYDAATGDVKIPGFYDDVQAATGQELANFVASGFDGERFSKAHHLLATRTKDNKEMLSRIMAEPTFEVHGIVGGHTGPGVKTIVPGNAVAKISARLVPNQKPEHVFKCIKEFIQERHPDVEIALDATLEPYLGELGGPFAKAAEAATEFAFGRKPAFIREGGSIGAVLTMKQELNAPIMLLGLSLPEHGYHAPNEYFDWGQASGGIKLFVKYFSEIAKIKGNA